MSFETKFSLKKALYRCREACPIGAVLFYFLLGQLSGHFYMTLGAPLMLVLGVLTILLSRYRSSLLILMCGALSMISVIPNSISIDTESSFLAKVISEPRFRRPGEISLLLNVTKATNSNGIFINLGKVSFKSQCKTTDLPWKNINGVSPGDVFAFKAKFRPLRPTLNPFTYSSSLLRKGISSTCKIELATIPLKRTRKALYSSREFLRSEVNSVLGNNERSGLLLSMAFGIRDVLSVQTERVFRETGLAHLLVVSGYQVSLMFVAAIVILKFFLLRMNYIYERALVYIN